MERPSILFLCTGNSARSILAETIANHRYGDRLRAYSAGSQPKGEVHPGALVTLAGRLMPVAGCRSESWEKYRDTPFDLVITLCDSAANMPCPVFPGSPAVVHWSLPDPPAAEDPQAIFQLVFDTLEAAIARLAAAPASELVETAKKAALLVERHCHAVRSTMI